MNEKLNDYLQGIFAPYDGVKSVAELKADLLSDLQERFRELVAAGQDEETAFELTIDSIGNIEETVRESAGLTRSLERHLLINFSGGNLVKSDFAGVSAHKGKFEASALRGSNFSGADLSGSSFKASDLREANFDGANLTDCVLTTLDLSGASFNKAILVRTEFSVSELARAKFIDVKFSDLKLNMLDLRKTVLENCSFDAVNFKYTDLRGKCLDGLSFVDVKFDMCSLNEATFRGATLKNVSFHSAYTWTTWSKKYYRAIKTICFDGAMMDKLTYAGLKSMEADLAKVIILS
ncbi:MAG: pentapeptide repeat-containing protein [Patescibacteria group bacterium]